MTIAEGFEADMTFFGKKKRAKLVLILQLFACESYGVFFI